MKEPQQCDLFEAIEISAQELQKEADARDRALDRLEVTRFYLVNLARDIAQKIAAEQGHVTSTEVMKALKVQIGEEALEGIDPRWLGAVFRSGTGWTRIGYTSTGSHARPQSIWARRSA